MLIEEIIRSCTNERVAEAAVASIGRTFYSRVREAAATCGLTVGAFATLAVERFARHGDEGEFRAVLCAMRDSQEPVLSGLHRILCIMLAAGTDFGSRRLRERTPRVTAMICAMEADVGRHHYV